MSLNDSQLLNEEPISSLETSSGGSDNGRSKRTRGIRDTRPKITTAGAMRPYITFFLIQQQRKTPIHMRNLWTEVTKGIHQAAKRFWGPSLIILHTINSKIPNSVFYAWRRGAATDIDRVIGDRNTTRGFMGHKTDGHAFEKSYNNANSDLDVLGIALHEDQQDTKLTRAEFDARRAKPKSPGHLYQKTAKRAAATLVNEDALEDEYDDSEAFVNLWDTADVLFIDNLSAEQQWTHGTSNKVPARRKEAPTVNIDATAEEDDECGEEDTMYAAQVSGFLEMLPEAPDMSPTPEVMDETPASNGTIAFICTLYCPKRDDNGDAFEYTLWSTVSKHIIATARSAEFDNHAKAIRQAGWLEDDFYTSEQPEEMIERNKGYRKKQRTKEKEAEEGPSKKRFQIDLESVAREQLTTRKIIKTSANGAPLVFVGTNPPPADVGKDQPKGKTFEEFIAEQKATQGPCMTGEQWLEMQKKNPFSMVPFGISSWHMTKNKCTPKTLKQLAGIKTIYVKISDSRNTILSQDN
ncbi:hypothetical protein GLAREA_07142 [Glarea lozoyensis ATCC 20868]|uniref:Uncharacterized protein n=1 Tax=Glarea lozoyensis (strain ATCC 20868 / MF5171) TaxID=1116229 RepID=S3DAH8_GLAL2|nr:uncharacterized protein GLAREA_07142 [Glarea lozoyensis ATCC 20868]EPE34129.1 hypothetical protein GLAREA_07142 [Glarea lozoyensis ATCC 20868]